MEERMGRIKWFDSARGFGFIEDIKGGKDLFFHIRKCMETKIEYLARHNHLKNIWVYFIESPSDEKGRRQVEALWLNDNNPEYVL